MPTELPASDADIDAVFERARGLHQQGELAKANALYRQVIAAAPGHAQALHMLGFMALQVGQTQPAADLMARAIAIAPSAEMYVNRAVALARLERLEDAGDAYAAAADMQPGLIQAHLGGGGLLLRLGQAEKALAAYDRALALDDALLAAQIGRGSALAAMGRLADALAAFDAAAICDASSAVAHFNRGLALRKLGRTEDAVAAFEAAIAASPDFARAHHQRAIALLQIGRLADGFAEYEWRKRTTDFEDPRYELPSPWTGGDVVGRTLFIYPERFLGDLLQFCRYAPLAEQRGAKVVMAAPRSMHALLRTLSPTLGLIAADETPPSFDCQCALLSLPRAFGGDIPANTPYLAADPARLAAWRARIGGGGFKIGVCWQGSTLPYAATLQRSFPLAALAPLAAGPDVRLISLQKHDGLDQLDTAPAGMAVETFGDADAGPDAFVDTAAIVTLCDLVVTADTAVAHLAGALGVPVWLALPALAEWRWQEHRDDSPWYPSMRLFRQPRPGDWDAVFAAMARALAAL